MLQLDWAFYASVFFNILALLYIGSYNFIMNKRVLVPVCEPQPLDQIKELHLPDSPASISTSRDEFIFYTRLPLHKDEERHPLLQDLITSTPVSYDVTSLDTINKKLERESQQTENTDGPTEGQHVTKALAEELPSMTVTAGKNRIMPRINNMTAAALKDILQCLDRYPVQRFAMRGDYWVLYNYVLAKQQFRCWESVTYTTHADYKFLDNLVPLLERWRGPISIALHAPGTDFVHTLHTIQYLITCGPDLVTELVTFHIYFHTKHMPKQIPHNDKLYTVGKIDCSAPAPWADLNGSYFGKPSYKAQNKLSYPVNVGRNIARESALTHYVLASDIELYPSPHIIPNFLDMILRQEPPLLRENPKVFPLQLFELKINMKLPADKIELVRMIKNHSALRFHEKVCGSCHAIPHYKEWLEQRSQPGLQVFDIGKRQGEFHMWEPIYIGTHSDPLYDERLSWDGKRDKMTQGYVLCLLDYEFHILDNAFMTHRPGIKQGIKDYMRIRKIGRTNTLIHSVILPELNVLYESRPGCKF